MQRWTAVGIDVMAHADRTLTVQAQVSCDDVAVCRITATARTLEDCNKELAQQVRELADARRKSVLDASVQGRTLVEWEVPG